MQAAKWIPVTVMVLWLADGLDGTAYAGYRIRLEKDVPANKVIGQPDVTFKLYASQEAATPIASQIFSYGHWSGEFVSPAKFISGQPPKAGAKILRIMANFTDTDNLTKDNDLWVEVELNGVLMGTREQANPAVWSLFAIESVYADMVTGTGSKPAAYSLNNSIYYQQSGATAGLTATNDLTVRVAALEAKLAKFSVSNDGKNIYITAANLNIRSGKKSTDSTVNGLGNLIIGYNETDGQTRTGSHNLIIGPYHSYSSYGGLVAGYRNTISGEHASVSGGVSNTASGYYSSVSGGASNTASGESTSVSGGSLNTADRYYASVSGGRGNTACEFHSSISGGYSNIACGYYSSVSGGASNTANGESTSISGGNCNIASGKWASVSGGNKNTASSEYSSISGGTYNMAIYSGASVSGGICNTASGKWASVSGGNNNKASGYTASVSGGYYNRAEGESSSITGGWNNWAHGISASVSGGSSNSAWGRWGSVSGGEGNTASSEYTSVSGGKSRSAGITGNWTAGTYSSSQ